MTLRKSDSALPAFSASACLHDLDECTVGLSFRLPDSIPHMAVLRKTFRGLSKSMGVHKQDADDLESIIGELATNAVRHARGGSYRVGVDFGDGVAIIVVVDQGDGFSLNAVDEPGTERIDHLSEEASTRIGGFGLPMIRMMADNIEVSANPPPAKGMTVRATKRLQKPSQSKA